MNYKNVYENWKRSELLSQSERAELENMTEGEIEDRFLAPLSFGTAGIRGVVGLGPARMNPFVLCQAVRGFARSMSQGATVVVCRDARLSSPALSRAAACALAEEGATVLYFKEPRPTPQLSFAIRHFKADGGLNLTASHNPKEYNGCKFYNRLGAQLAEEESDPVAEIMKGIEMLSPLPRLSFDEYVAQGKIKYLECDDAYIAAVLSSRKGGRSLEDSDLRVVYTPFHGVGGAVMTRVFKGAGLKSVYYQKKQMHPDGHFTTLNNPNPEYTEGFKMAEKLAQEVCADIIVATDPDADRVAVSVRDRTGAYVPLSGNKTGALLSDYLLPLYRGEKRAAVIKTIVTTPLVESIADNFGAECFSVFTGFKNIAEKLEAVKDEYSTVIGFEESIGYMVGDHVRDKDGISGALTICEMAAWYKKNGLSLLDRLQMLSRKYGDWSDSTVNLYRYGTEGAEEIRQMMVTLRQCPPEKIGGFKVQLVCDYLTGENAHIKGSDVLEYRLEGGSRVLVRPSGTEPKIKIYALCKDTDPEKLGAELLKLISKE